jgi:tetratricopeptide (TPR) repeat protein
VSTHKNIFKQQAPISEQEMRDYLDGKLSKKQQHELEMKLQDSPFAAEATEGFSENPEALQNLWRLKTKVNLRAERLNPSKWKFQYTLAAASVAAIVVVLAGKFFLFDAKLPEATLVADNLKKTPTEETLELNFKKELIEIEQAEELPETLQITSQRVVRNTPTIVVAEDSEVSMQADMIAENNEPKPAMQMNSRKAEAVPSSIAMEDPIVTPKTKTKLVSGLMVVDYSESYTQEKSGATLSGTPAKYRTLADTTQEKITHSEAQQTFTYDDFLEISLNKYKQNKYKQALVNFLTILNKYPNDLNAHYYGGLCYYNINNPTKALEFFDYILTHDHNAFYQEAQFYKALCLQRLGEYGKANFLLKKIVAQNGFFAEQAKVLLEKEK